MPIVTQVLVLSSTCKTSGIVLGLMRICASGRCWAAAAEERLAMKRPMIARFICRGLTRSRCKRQ